MFYPSEFGRIYEEEVELVIFTGTSVKQQSKVHFMNLHEECLLKYLKSPDDLSYSTDILKLNNQILEQHFVLENILTKNLNLGYNNKS